MWWEHGWHVNGNALHQHSVCIAALMSAATARCPSMVLHQNWSCGPWYQGEGSAACCVPLPLYLKQQYDHIVLVRCVSLCVYAAL
jgi:hypothetical protein